MKQAILLLAICVLPVAAFAHPPKAIDLSYDPAAQLLTVTVDHSIKASPVSDPARHFVKDVALLVNGKAAVNAVYRYQQFVTGEIVVFKLNLKEGDQVTVTGTCSLAGNKTSELTVKGK